MIGRVLGTYLHGPVLAQNPALADLLLRLGRSRICRSSPGRPEAEVLRRARCARSVPSRAAPAPQISTMIVIGPVVDQADLHVGSEDPGCYFERRARAARRDGLDERLRAPDRVPPRSRTAAGLCDVSA